MTRLHEKTNIYMITWIRAVNQLLIRQFLWGPFWGKIVSSLKSHILEIDFISSFLTVQQCFSKTVNYHEHLRY